MKTLLRILLSLVLLVIIVATLAYADGATLPVDHSITVNGTVPASPDKVFSLITNVAAGGTWRPAVKSVKLLPPDNGRDHWVEDLGHGQTMDFLATRTDPISPSGTARRDVLLNEPSATYGGTWTYEISPGPTAASTTLRITEAGFIHPPVYRFMMAHVFGPTRNLDQYMTDIQTAAAKP